jgi:hypothetical protein
VPFLSLFFFLEAAAWQQVGRPIHRLAVKMNAAAPDGYKASPAVA